jgi:hypothetical protein
LGEAEAGVETLGGLHDPLGRAVFKERREIGAGGEAVPLLRPAIIDPVGGDAVGDQTKKKSNEENNIKKSKKNSLKIEENIKQLIIDYRKYFSPLSKIFTIL